MQQRLIDVLCVMSIFLIYFKAMFIIGMFSKL